MLRKRNLEDSLPQLAKWLAVLVCAVYPLALFLGAFVPMHPDDMLYPFYFTRQGYDGWLMPKQDYGGSIPWIFLPGRLLAFANHSLVQHAFLMKLTNMLLMLALAGMTVLLLRKHHPKLPIVLAAGLVCGAYSLGELPFLQMVSRPETGILVVVVFFASVPYLLENNDWRVRTAVSLLVFLSLSWLYTAHAKSLFLIPYLLICCAFCYRHSRRLALIYGFLVVAMAFASFYYWSGTVMFRGYSPEHLNDRSAYLSPKSFFRSPAEFIQVYLGNITELQRYFDQMRMGARSPWIIKHKSPSVTLFNVVLLLSLWTLVVLIATSIFRFAMGYLKTRKNSHALILSLGILWIFLMQLGMQNHAPSYDTFYLAGLLALLAIPASAGLQEWSHSERTRNLLAIVFLGISLISIGTLLARNTPHVISLHTNDTRMKNKGMLPFYYDTHRAKVVEAAAMCGFTPTADTTHILLDRSTYFPMRATFQPVEVGEKINQSQVAGLKNFRKNGWKRSNGAVVSCSALRPGMQKDAKRVDNICCVTADILHNWEDPNPGTKSKKKKPKRRQARP